MMGTCEECKHWEPIGDDHESGWCPREFKSTDLADTCGRFLRRFINKKHFDHDAKSTRLS